MKLKLLFVISMILLIIATSCKSDDEAPFEDLLLEGTIYRGDLYLKTQANIQFYSDLGITEIEGLLSLKTQLDDPIVDLTPLSSIVEVRYLSIINNPLLVTLEGLENMESLDGFYLQGNESLVNINALNIGSNYSGYLGMVNLPSLMDYSLLNNTEEIGFLALENLPLINLEPFSQIKNMRSLSISNLNELENLESLNLESFNGRLNITKNDNLESLSGLESIIEVGEFSEVEIYLNPVLTDFCSLDEFTQQTSSQDLYTVWGNGLNPTFQDLLDGNCN